MSTCIPLYAQPQRGGAASGWAYRGMQVLMMASSSRGLVTRNEHTRSPRDPSRMARRGDLRAYLRANGSLVECWEAGQRRRLCRPVFGAEISLGNCRFWLDTGPRLGPYL